MKNAFTDWHKTRICLVKRLESLGMSQDLLAAKVRVHRNTINRWETNGTVPSALELMHWATALGMRVATELVQEERAAA